MNSTLIIAGGGTGGHVLPGVALADAWKKKYGNHARVLFVGAHGGIEEKLVPQAGYPLTLLSVGSLKRVSWIQRLKTVFQLPLSFLFSFMILIREKPRAVVGVGGYASGPFVLVASLLSRWMKIRTGILEFNAVPGLTNRILGKFAGQIFLAFDAEIESFAEGKTSVTGTPVRSQLQPLAPAQLDPFTVFIFGGSQGAMGINSLVIDCLDHLGEWKNKIHWIHQTGEKDFHRVLEAYQKAGVKAVVEKFVYDMASTYSKASLLICRAGASTLSEIATVRRAAILIPLPTSADGHQEKNAHLFSSKSAAILARQPEMTGTSLARLIVSLAENPTQIRQMESKVAFFYRPNAAQSVLSLLVDPAARSA